ncbi:hypothetical protein PHYPSEUDO_004634 [Phytophthora pseudosyringae]|uniref:Protein kinase domain-containing protein n=1 Tax=Phytophthora pseudosyringae TaxID=221518 RepID=A0A8T1VT49_9STRA|nr:hypothetical protein PHYPSEUDO_004634 [Phytophthora pseudosyringae]
MQSTRIALVAAFALGVWSSCATAATSTGISCDRVALGSQSATKWTVSCTTEGAATVSSAYFNPLLVKNFYVDSGVYIAASGSDLKLSLTFSEVDALVSSSVTTFSLLAASGVTPATPVTIVSTAFEELSALQTLHLEGIPLADSDLHLVLPASIQQISIVGCGLSNFSFEFVDGSASADSGLSIIDLRLNELGGIPSFIYDLPSGVSTIDLRNNTLELSTETAAHKKQLAEWISADILQIDSDSRMTLDSSSKTERNSIVGTATAADNGTHTDNHPATDSSGSEENVKQESSSSMDVIPVTILSIVIPAVVAVGVTLALVIRKRRRMQDRETDAILDLPHPFDKSSRDRSETSGHFTAIESELSRSRMSSAEGHQSLDDRDSCVIVPMSPTDAEQPQEISTSARAGYLNLASPHEAHQSVPMTIMKRQVSRREDGDSSNSLELLSTHSTSSATPSQARIAARNALRFALETLLATKTNDAGHSIAPLLTVNAYQYSFGSGTRIEETPLAFFIDCRLAGRTLEEAAPEPAPLGQLVIKVFIEGDADLAGRESYALSCLQHDDVSRALAPRLFDDALEYELDVKDAAKLSCCILVLDKPSCSTLHTSLATSREPLEQQIARVVNALRALHSRGLVHGGLDPDSLVACSPDGRLKFWGLEHVSRAGHKIPCPDPDLLGVSQAECISPELAVLALEETPCSRTSPSLDIWSLGVMILKMHAAGRQLEEFKGCTSAHEVFERLSACDVAGEAANACFFERSIAQFVLNDDMKNLLRQSLQRTAAMRPSVDSIAKHKLFQANTEREVSRTTTVRSAAVTRMLSAILEEKDVASSRGPNDSLLASDEPERETSGKEQVLEKVSEVVTTGDDGPPEPLPPSLWLFLPPVELQVDLTQRASFFSIDQWVSNLKRLQQQRAEELRFPLVFMCESCESVASVPCSIATTTEYGASVPSSLLPLVMPLVRETMLFLEARAIVSNGLGVGEASGLAGPQQWDELRTFYSALERMELATVNPVNEIELAPMEKRLKSREPSKAQQVLDKLTGLIFSEEKREYVRNLLDALVSDEDLATQTERSSWAALRRCDVAGETSSASLSRTRWLCSHHAPKEK